MFGVLTADRVAYRYSGNSMGLEPVSIGLQAGDALLVAGPSGCGKSTLARCLTGMIPHLYRGQLTGNVSLCGLDSRLTPLWRLSECAGFVFQNPAAQLVASSVEDEILFGLENLGLARAEMRTRLDEALVRFGLDTLRARSPLTLSGGEQQKLVLAATLARHPPILVMDEPLSMLDSAAAEMLVNDLASVAQAGTAIVICEHRFEPLATLPGLRTLRVAPPHEPSSQAGAVVAAPLSAVPSFSLVVEDLGVSLGQCRVLNELAFQVPGGQIMAIVGRNGVGKTTLLRALAGLQRHDGSVLVNGQRPDLAMVFQNPDLQFFNPTVREEILYGISEPDLERYQGLLQILGLSAYAQTPPLLLSEGEKKRVALAIALMRGPRHGVLLDEPSLGQDAAHKACLMRLARAVADSGRSVIMTTHDLSLAAQADRMALLGEAGFLADGRPGEVLRDSSAWSRSGLKVAPWILAAQAEDALCN